MFRMNGMTRVHGCTGVASLHNKNHRHFRHFRYTLKGHLVPSRGSYSMAVVCRGRMTPCLGSKTLSCEHWLLASQCIHHMHTRKTLNILRTLINS